MNKILKSDRKIDLSYTVNLMVFALVLLFVMNIFVIFDAEGDRNNAFFYLYLVVTMSSFHGIYCYSKARMDRFFAMRVNRKVFFNNCVLSSLIRSAMTTVVYGGIGYLGLIWRDSNVAFFQAVSNHVRLDEKQSLEGVVIFIFLFAVTINSHLIFDYSTEKSAITTSAYFDSMSIWARTGRRKSQGRNENRILYLVFFIVSLVIGYIGVLICSFQMINLAIVVAIMVAYNVFLLVSAKKKFMKKDIM